MHAICTHTDETERNNSLPKKDGMRSRRGKKVSVKGNISLAIPNGAKNNISFFRCVTFPFFPLLFLLLLRAQFVRCVRCVTAYILFDWKQFEAEQETDRFESVFFFVVVAAFVRFLATNQEATHRRNRGWENANARTKRRARFFLLFRLVHFFGTSSTGARGATIDFSPFGVIAQLAPLRSYFDCAASSLIKNRFTFLRLISKRFCRHREKREQSQIKRINLDLNAVALPHRALASTQIIIFSGNTYF